MNAETVDQGIWKGPRTAAVATLGLAVAAWAVTLWEMGRAESGSGSLAFLIAWWGPMMAAMMLPGAVPAVWSRVQAGGVRAAPLFVGPYLVLWTLVGVTLYAACRPHGALAAGALVIAAGVYEVTPLKRRFRRQCRSPVGSGLEYGLYCVGSSIGLMLMLVALGAMSVGWMSVIAVLLLAQKLLPARPALDVPPALAIIGLGLGLVFAPSSVPGFTPPM